MGAFRPSFKPLFAAVLALLAQVPSHARERVYEVRGQDTLSEIAQRHFPGAVYGEEGSLLKLMSRNPQIDDQDLIFPDQEIVVEPEDESLPFAMESPPAPPPIEEGRNGDGSISDPLLPPPVSPLSRFRLGSALYYSSIRGVQKDNGTRAELVSDAGFALELAWARDWSEKFASEIQATLRHQRYRAFAGTALEQGSPLQSAGGLGFLYRLTADFAGLLSFHYAQESQYRARTPTVFVLENVAVPRFEVGATYRLFHFQAYELGVSGHALFYLPAQTENYALESGTGYRFALDLKKTMLPSPDTLDCGVFYQVAQQNSATLDRNRIDLGLACSYSWSFKKH